MKKYDIDYNTLECEFSSYDEIIHHKLREKDGYMLSVPDRVVYMTVWENHTNGRTLHNRLVVFANIRYVDGVSPKYSFTIADNEGITEGGYVEEYLETLLTDLEEIIYYHDQ